MEGEKKVVGGIVEFWQYGGANEKMAGAAGENFSVAGISVPRMIRTKLVPRFMHSSFFTSFKHELCHQPQDCSLQGSNQAPSIQGQAHVTC